MVFVRLVTVGDEGAGEMVRSTLAEAGIPVEVKREFPEHPYRAGLLAEPWQILVPDGQMTEAQKVLARLEHDMAEEVEAQALAAGPPPTIRASPPALRPLGGGSRPAGQPRQGQSEIRGGAGDFRRL